MGGKFETLGNATVLLFENGRPILATDPWLVGRCYFGSWALDHPLTPQQIADVVNSENIWISHGHPDHLHHESLSLLPRGKRILIPDHYDREIHDFLRDRGFAVTVLEYRRWYRLSPSTRVLCLDNMNQDAILVIQTGDSLLIDLNDSPIVGEFRFVRDLIRQHPNKKTYLLKLCAVDADMINFVDRDGNAAVGSPPEDRKPGAIRAVARLADRLGVQNYCCFSSQHLYVRADSVWANPYRTTWDDMQRHWDRPSVRLIEPFVTVDLTTGEIISNHSSHRADETQITDATGEDDWTMPLSSDEWDEVGSFVQKLQLLRRHVDFLEFAVGGETRRFGFGPTRNGHRGVRFVAPKQSLLEAVRSGYFDDLLIGNFMKVNVQNVALYPHISPVIAKLGGNAKVFTRQDYARFLFHYFRRNPLGTMAYLLDTKTTHALVPMIREKAEAFGIKRPLKFIYRAILRDAL